MTHQVCPSLPRMEDVLVDLATNQQPSATPIGFAALEPGRRVVIRDHATLTGSEGVICGTAVEGEETCYPVLPDGDDKVVLICDDV